MPWPTFFNEEQQTEVLYKALDRWGPEVQAGMCQTEFAECSAALGRYYIQNRKNDVEVIDELADAEIMLMQMKIMHGESFVDERIQQKLKRLNEIIEGNIQHPHINDDEV